MPMPDEISLRDQIRERLDLEKQVRDERHAAYQREQLLLADQCDERWAAHHKVHELEGEALELQANEYERRLEDLNHSHALAQEKEAEYVKKDLNNAELEKRDQRILALEKFQANIMGRLVIIGGLIIVVVAVLTVLLSRWPK